VGGVIPLQFYCEPHIICTSIGVCARPVEGAEKGFDLFPNLYILPGVNRNYDEVVLAADVTFDRRAGLDGVFVSRKDAVNVRYPFVLPCIYRPLVPDLEAFEDFVGRKIKLQQQYGQREDLTDESDFGRVSYIALLDGAVYERRQLSRELESLRKLRCVVPRDHLNALATPRPVMVPVVLSDWGDDDLSDIVRFVP